MKLCLLVLTGVAAGAWGACQTDTTSCTTAYQNCVTKATEVVVAAGGGSAKVCPCNTDLTGCIMKRLRGCSKVSEGQPIRIDGPAILDSVLVIAVGTPTLVASAPFVRPLSQASCFGSIFIPAVYSQAIIDGVCSGYKNAAKQQGCPYSCQARHTLADLGASYRLYLSSRLTFPCLCPTPCRALRLNLISTSFPLTHFITSLSLGIVSVTGKCVARKGEQRVSRKM